jgi:hypothetical protein
MRVRVILAVALLVVGGVWIGQGIGLIGGSFMTGEAIWAVIGVVVVMLGLALLSGALRTREEK